jgi:hypothetical protein
LKIIKGLTKKYWSALLFVRRGAAFFREEQTAIPPNFFTFAA